MGFFSKVKEYAPDLIGAVLSGGATLPATALRILGKELTGDENATESQIEEACKNATPEQLVALQKANDAFKTEYLKQSGESNRTMLETEMKSTHSTRPFIAKWSFIFVAIFSGTAGLMVLGFWGYAIYEQNKELVDAVVDGWPFVLAVIGSVTSTFAILLKAYFGILAKEQEQRLGAITGQFKPGVIASMIGSFKK